MMRLDKFLCSCKLGTRTEVKKLIKSKLVKVNGELALKPEMKVDELLDQVEVRGQRIAYEEYSYYIYNKRAGFITAVTDAKHKTVMDDIPEDIRKSLAPVGRLDKDTEGLLLLTNDGEFTHHILSPAHHIPKTYYAELDNPLQEEAVAAFDKGLDIGDEDLTLPAELEILPEIIDKKGLPRYPAKVTIHEGRYHQVKRMFGAFGCKVLYLKRLSIGDLTLEGLGPGDVRKLTEEEVLALSKKSN